jgi:hypothetical protein
VCVCVCVHMYKRRERKILLIRHARDQQVPNLSNIPGLSDGTCTQLKFLLVNICCCSHPWAVQTIRGVLHFEIFFIYCFRVIMTLFFRWCSRRHRATKYYNGWCTYNFGVLFKHVPVIFTLHTWRLFLVIRKTSDRWNTCRKCLNIRNFELSVARLRKLCHVYARLYSLRVDGCNW